MPTNDGLRKYGSHSYGNEGTRDCAHGCGCWMGGCRSGGPTGLDPFGACPNNPLDGKRLPGNQDYHNVVTERIETLTDRADKAEAQLKRVRPSKIALAEQLEATKRLLSLAKSKLSSIKDISSEIIGWTT